MAYVTIEKTEKHLVERAEGRFNRLKEEAARCVQRIKEGLEEQAPEDWRFTTSPVARFLIWDESTDFRIVGRTYRDSDLDRRVLSELGKPSLKMDEIVQEYLQLIREPAARICHELKTILKKGQDISQLKQSYRLARVFLPHVIPIDARRVATRPNAVLTGEQELWARQNELLSLDDGQTEEYLLFERLTPRGLDKSAMRIYRHDMQGNIRFDKAMTGKPSPLYLKRHALPSGFRSASYWSLPTYVDAVYMDLLYKAERYEEGKAVADMSPKEALLLLKIEALHAKVRDILKLPAPDRGVLPAGTFRIR